MDKNREVVVLTPEKFVDLIQNEIKGTTFVTASCETDARLKKTGNPYKDHEVTKLYDLNGCIGFDYAKSVNKERVKEEKESDFEANSRKWGTLLEGRKLVEHKGNYYLQFKVENVSPVKYLLDHETEIEKEKIEEFLPKSSSASNQNLEKEVIVRDVKLSSIKEIKMKGKIYKLVFEE